MNEYNEKRTDVDIAEDIEITRNNLHESIGYNLLFVFGWALFYLSGLLSYILHDWLIITYICWAISGVFWILLAASALDSFEWYEALKRLFRELRNFRHEKGDYGNDEMGSGEG